MNGFDHQGFCTHYRVDGPTGAPAIVFANSLGTDVRIWDEVVGELAGEFCCVRYDKRGHGLSDVSDGPYRMEVLAGDLGVLLDHLGISRTILCGVSVGGMIAQELYRQRPELVSGLVLMDTAHKVGPASMWDDRIRAIRDGGILALADAILERWFTSAFRRERSDELACWRNMLVRTPLEGYLGVCAALRDADLTAAAGNIEVPTLCVVGAEDGATPPDLVRELCERIPSAEFEVIEGAGHLPCIEQPAFLIKMIRNFLARKPHV